ncbi:MAG: hypothetical protein OEV42_08550 [Deltaproteobacteria bacterium]|nr:hypothetical protein [Deltaproteobacteria bacterium]
MKDIFRRLLTALWLRPERALWDAHELFIVREFLGNNFAQPSLEYGCTDGVPTFIMLGGEFELSFDDYQEVAWDRNAYKDHSMLESDYFNNFNPDQEKESRIRTFPTSYFECGISWKEAHIKKSERLSIYKRLVCNDLGAPLDMLDDNYFATIFAPNLFWLEEDKLESTIVELKRVLQPEGRIITIFPDASQQNHLFHRFAEVSDTQWINDLDRGIHINLTHHARELDEWEKYFSQKKMRISRHERFIPSLVSEVYQIGFRPMFPVFMNMYEKLRTYSEDEWMDLKKHWIETAYHFFSPMCDTEWMEMENVWHIFELQPSRHSLA